jgi:type 2 lantibiotic biosynthesis protein LanM
VAIDVELLLQPSRRADDPSESANRTAGDESCLETGMLSFLQMGPDGEMYDIGALRGRRQVAISRPKRVWKNTGLDAIHFIEERQSDLEAASEVRLGDRLQRPEDFAEYIKQGFARTYRFLMAHRAALQDAGGPMSLFAGRTTRVVVRATDHYATLIHLLASPNYQADGAARSAAIDVLNRPFSRARARPSIWALAVAERRALERLDIPRLTAPVRDTDVYADGERVAEKFFVRSGYEEVAARVDGLSERGLEGQLWLLDRALASSVSSRFDADLVRLDPQSTAGDGPSPVEFLAHALWIAGELEARAIQGADGLQWSLAPEFLDRPAVREHNLYDGSVGPALFFAALASVTADERWTSAAREALRPVVRAFDAGSPESFAREAEIGGCSGLGSIAYALTLIGKLLPDPQVSALAGRIALTITEARIKSDRYFDIVGGAAGAIVGLLAVFHELGDNRLLDRAALCGEHLLASQVTHDGASAWPSPDRRFLSGFGHGAAGIAHALVRLYAATGRRAFLEGALRAHSFERSLYVPVHRNWAIALPDDRLGVDGIGMTAWCHGAPGIALSRLALLDIVDDPVFFSQITTAIATTSAAAGHGSDHLCCGNMGRVEALATIGRRLNDEDALAGARKLVERVMKRAAGKGHFRLTAAGFEYPVFQPGFFRGLSGIGYQFLRLVAPANLPSVLLFQDAADEGGEPS